ncbi:MAG: L,D-transpeptidase family protein [Salaquimonas sp.]|jgi:murein L,D-transpeptidase YcbB/YkuD|nr:L,D-transpeptidase family protein [Salaquimonas sp.]
MDPRQRNRDFTRPTRRAAGLFAICLIAFAFWLPAAMPASAQLMGPAIKAELNRAISEAKSESLKKRLKDIDAYYAKSLYSPIWVTGNRPNAKAEEMVDALNLSYEDGLNPGDYDAFELFAKLGATTTEQLADLEVHLSTAAVSYAQHMNSGRLNPSKVNREIVIYPDKISADTILSNIRKTKTLKAYLRLLAPHTARYERLRQTLALFRRIEANGGWTKVSSGATLKPGAADPRVPTIRKRMIEAGTYNGANSGLVYDAALVDAVKRFQDQNGVTPDGVVGPGTVAVMNITVDDRIKTIELNMERNRWMQNDFAPYHIFVNLADQVVKLVKNGDTLHAEVVQVGQPYHRTPVFTDEMEYVELNPYWNVPPSIAVNEYLPKLRKNPNVLAPQNISVMSSNGPISASAVNWSSYGKGNFPFRLRQEPGPGNALGRVKFMFPNKFNVYMHDTPAKSKFDRTQRYFSHGCIRLHDPLKMAEYILGPEGWSRAKIDQVVASGKNTVVKLKHPIPVYVVYLTAFVNKDGSVWFREDVYGRDKILADALAKVRGH